MTEEDSSWQRKSIPWAPKGYGAKAIVFQLENPFGVVECLRQARERQRFYTRKVAMGEVASGSDEATRSQPEPLRVVAARGASPPIA
jgi:hypothetical protein